MKTFDDRFRALYPAITELARKYARTTSVPAEEYESYLCEEFIAIDKSFDRTRNDSYRAFVISMLDRKAKVLARPNLKERKFHDSITPIEVPDDEEEEAKYPVELIADVDIEEQIFDVMFVEETIERYEGETRDILREFFADPYASFRDIGKRLGIEDKRVKRRLQAVAKEVRGL